MSGNKIKARIIDTGNGCFISDCFASDGYEYNYHSSKLKNLLFDGVYPAASYKKNWLFIPKFPTKIQKEVGGGKTNYRWELKDKSLSDKFKEVIPDEYSGEDYDFYFDDENMFKFDSLYDYKSDEIPKALEDVEIEWENILKISDFKEPPKINFKGISRIGWSDTVYTIDNEQVKHFEFDEMIIPEILIHNRSCFFTSKQVYDITRQWVKDHINNNVVQVTTDNDLCFEVKKKIPLYEEKVIHYQNLFGRTKKERNKWYTTTKKYRDDCCVFEMTSKEKHYQGYTPIAEMYANSEEELQDKMQDWLDYLIGQINKPLIECPHCKGKGVIEIPDKVKANF